MLASKRTLNGGVEVSKMVCEVEVRRVVVGKKRKQAQGIFDLGFACARLHKQPKRGVARVVKG